MNWEVFVTCAVTGAGDTAGRSEHVPVTPEQIADSAIEAARAGAAIVHIHVRDPDTAKGARDPALYRAVVERIRASDVDVVLNLTAGMGGDLVLGGDESPLPVDDAGTDMVGAAERLAHVEELLPEICTLDCGTMNFAAGGDYVMVNTPGMLRAMAARVQELGVRPELEVFDTGHLVFVHELIKDGLIDDPPLIQLCTGSRTARPTISGRSLRWSTGFRRTRSSLRSRSGGCNCRSSRWPRSSAATRASGSRTISISRAVASRRMRSSSNVQ